MGSDLAVGKYTQESQERSLANTRAWTGQAVDFLKTHWPLWPILGVAFLFRLWGSKSGLPYLYNPGESIIVRQALAYGTGTLRPYSFVYPPLYSYLLFGLYGLYFLGGKVSGAFATVDDFAISYFMDPTPFYWIGRLLTALSGVATVGVVYLIASRAYGRKEGAIAALFLAVSHLHVVHSHYALTDVPMTFMVMLSAWLLLRASMQGKPSWTLAGASIGVAAAMKYPAALMATSLLVAVVIWAKRFRLPPRTALSAASVGLTAALVGFVVACPYAVLDFRALWADLIGAQLGLNLGIAKPWFEIALFYLQTLTGSGLGRLLGSFSLLAIVYLLYRRLDQDILLLSFPLFYMLFLTTQGRYQPNWLLPALPFFCIFAATTITSLAHRYRGPGHAAYPSILLSVAILAFFPTWSSYFYGKSINQKDTRTLAKEWIEANLPAGSKILLDSSSNGPPLYPTVESLQRYFEHTEEDKSIATRPEAAQKAFDSYRRYQLEAARRYAEIGITYDLDYMQLAWWRAEEDAPDLEEFPVFGAYRERIFSLDQLREAGFDYVIVSSFKYRQYLTPAGKERWPSYYQFYRSLEEECQLVKAFYADPVHQPGPDIKIYDLRSRP